MYLSRMYLNKSRRATREYLANPEKLHAAIENTYQTDPGQPRRTLWRIDESENSIALYLVTPIAPSFEGLQESAGWSQQMTWDSRDYSILLDRLMKGQQYSFKLTANPSRIVTDDKGKKKRKAEVGPKNQLNWLLTRADDMGVKFVELDEGSACRVVGTKRLDFRKKNHRVTVVTATFTGVLEVTDPEKLRAILRNGIGRAKAYGCGLLTLAPVGS